MKRRLLFSLVGAVILFGWQFLSFAITGLHEKSMEFTPAQDKILQVLEETGLEEGMYHLGRPDPSLSQEEQQKVMENYAGKPWATINYQKEMDMDMVMPMIRGLVVCLVLSFILFWVFQQIKDPTIAKRIMLALAIGIIGFLFVPYSNFIWYKEPDIWGYVVDAIVPWLILGIVGHLMSPKPVTASLEGE